jgi:membrane-bound lytic murein transglycosylase B
MPTGPAPPALRPAPAPAAPALVPGPGRHRRPTDTLLLAPARMVGRAARSGGRSLVTWSGRPSGRFVLPLVAIVALLAATGAVGNYVTRASAPAVHPTDTTSAAPSDGAAPGASAPTGGGDVALDPGATTGPGGQQPTHPQEVVAQWAKRMSPAVGISETALKAYGYAALRVADELPACHLAWTTLAAIGKVESDHGTAKGATLQADGSALPPIIGAPLDGQGGRALVPDTDAGRLDGDRAYDHAVGPMQFLPRTWLQNQVDADADGRADPNNLNDAALAAGRYLCAGGKDLATSDGWPDAVRSYNELEPYVKRVFDAANEYGLRSRSVA